MLTVTEEGTRRGLGWRQVLLVLFSVLVPGYEMYRVQGQTWDPVLFSCKHFVPGLGTVHVTQ